MSLGLESIVIGALVAGALAWAVRAVYRSVRHTGGCSSCSSSGDCPLTKNPEAMAELVRLGRQLPPTPCHSHGEAQADRQEMAAPRARR
jgi:hypothetical protein